MSVELRSRRRPVHVLAPISVVCALIVITACGASKPATLHRADFIKQADAICGPTTSKLDAIPPPNADDTPAQVATIIRQTLDIIESALKQLRALHAQPSDFAVLQTNFIAFTDAQDAAAHRLLTALQQPNLSPEAQQAAMTTFSTSIDDPDQVAHDKALADFGFHDCANTNQSSTPTTLAPALGAVPFTATDAGFSAVFPLKPSRQVVPETQAGVSLQVTFYQATTSDEQVGVGFSTSPVAPTGAAIQNGLDNSINGVATRVKGTVTSKTHLTFLAQPAIDGVVTSPSGVIHVRTVLSGHKVYVIESIVAAADSPHPGYDQLLATFRIL